ncbi:MAG: lysylphosphatidylglycerol synthase transmembrane domain-containing protein [Alphaproteobacteria bacterium]
MTALSTGERLARSATDPRILLTVAIALQAALLVYALLQNGSAELLLKGLQGLLAAQALYLAAVLILILRFRLLFPPPAPGLLLAARSTLIGIGLNFVLPARLSELPRIACLSSSSDVPAHRSMSAIMLEKLADVLALVLTVLALAVLQPHLPIPPTGLLLAMAGFLGAMIAARRAVIALLRHAGLTRLADFAEAMIVDFVRGLRQPSFIPAVLLSLASFGLVIVANRILLDAILPEPLPWLSVTLLFAVSILGAAASTLPGGTGGFHGAVIVTLIAVDIDTGTASVAALALHAQQFVITLPLALLCLRREHLDIVAWFRRAARQPPAASSDAAFDRSSPAP